MSHENISIILETRWINSLQAVGIDSNRGSQNDIIYGFPEFAN